MNKSNHTTQTTLHNYTQPAPQVHHKAATSTRTTVTATTTATTTRSAASSDTESSSDLDAHTYPSQAPSEKMEQSLFVIPSHMLNCSPVPAARNASDQSPERDLDGPGDGYEPCYRPFDIFAIYQNRLSFQGKRKTQFSSIHSTLSTLWWGGALSSPSPLGCLLSSVFPNISPGTYRCCSRCTNTHTHSYLFGPKPFLDFIDSSIANFRLGTRCRSEGQLHVWQELAETHCPNITSIIRTNNDSHSNHNQPK